MCSSDLEPSENGILKMDFEKWMPLLECSKDEIEEILLRHYVSEDDRLSLIWEHLGFCESAVIDDINSFEWVEEHDTGRFRKFEEIVRGWGRESG